MRPPLQLSVLCLVLGLVITLVENQDIFSRYSRVCKLASLKFQSQFNSQRKLPTAEDKAVITDNTRVSRVKKKKKYKYIGGNRLYYPNSMKTFRLLLVCGDVELNPGPTDRKIGNKDENKSRWKYPCVECAKPVKKNQEGILCADCGRWYHAGCAGISKNKFRSYYMKHPDDNWSCVECSMCNPTDSFFDDIQEESNYGYQSSSSSHVNLEYESSVSIINEYDMKLFELLEDRNQQPDEGLIIHININSIQNKFDELKTPNDKLKSSIIFISETKIDHTYPNSQFQLNGYYLYRCDRAKGDGGLIAYFSSKLPSKQVKLPKKYKTCEVLAIDTKVGNNNMLFVGIYRPPRHRTGSSCTKYMENVEVELNDICMWASLQRKSVVIIGDLNIDRLRRKWKVS